MRRGIAEIRIADVLWPPRWPNVRTSYGRAAIRAALQFEREGRPAEARSHVTFGLERIPADREGRLLAARLLLFYQLPEAARQMLRTGLAFHRDDAHYLQATFSLLLHQQRDDEVVSLARDLLRQSPAAAGVAHVAALAGATASFLRGNYDEVEELLRAAPHLSATRDGRLLTARCDWERGHRELALLHLRALADEFPADQEVQTELLQCLRQAGARDELRRRSIAAQIALPSAASARVQLLHAYHLSGDTPAVEREVTGLLAEFERDASALGLVANFAATTGQVPLAQRILEHARTRGLPWDAFAFLHLEAMLVARDYAPALETLRALQHDQPEWKERYSSLIASIQAVANCGLGDITAARSFVNQYLDEPAPRAENLLAVANRFIALDATEHARRILLRAVELERGNQAALTRLVELDLNLNRIDALPAHLQRLAAMRKPSLDVLRVAQHKLGSDLFLFSKEREPALDALRSVLDSAQPAAARN